MKCKSCGSEILPGYKFCSNCGDKIDQDKVEELPSDSKENVPEEQIKVDTVRNDNSSNNTAEMDKGNETGNQNSKSKEQKKRISSAKILAIAISLVVISAALFFVTVKFVKEKMKVYTPYASTECIGKSQEQVREDFSVAGFKEISVIALDDLEYDYAADTGNIEVVSINGVSVFDGNQEFKNSDSIVIKYHTPRKIYAPVSSSEAKTITTYELKNLFSNAGFHEVTESEIVDLDPDETSAEFVSEVRINNSYADENRQYPVTSKVEIITHKPFVKYTLVLKIDFIGNWIFDKYDVALKLDKYSNKLKHGEDAALQYRLRPGNYTISFIGAGSSSSKGSAEIDIHDDTEASYQISCYSDHIDVKKQYIEYKHAAGENEAIIPASPASCKNTNYKTVQELFSKAGFTNISYKVIYDIIWGVTPNGAVEKITVDGKDNFERGDVFSKDVPIVITYHMPTEDNPDKPTPTVAPTNRPTHTPTTPKPTPTRTPKPTPTPKKSYSDSEVKSMLRTLFSTQFSSKEYKVNIEKSMLNIYFFPEGFTAAVYNASVLGDRSAIRDWNSLVSTAKTWSKDITREVHDTMGRDDLSVVLYYCDNMGSENVFLVVMDGVVYYDLVNDVNLLGIG